MVFGDNTEFAEWFKKRTKAFATEIIKFCSNLKENPATRVITYQLIKSATSTAANYRASCRARSAAEFFSKLSIVVEEADESLFWLELIKDTDLYGNKEELNKLINEAEEITAISAKSRKTMSERRKKKQ